MTKSSILGSMGSKVGVTTPKTPDSLKDRLSIQQQFNFLYLVRSDQFPDLTKQVV